MTAGQDAPAELPPDFVDGQATDEEIEGMAGGIMAALTDPQYADRYAQLIENLRDCIRGENQLVAVMALHFVIQGTYEDNPENPGRLDMDKACQHLARLMAADIWKGLPP